jgi:uncharacterized NAD(P)/FAD-binding protein YdhS
MPTPHQVDIAIIGGGCAGSLIAAQLGESGAAVALIDASPTLVRGAAYSTTWPEHLLNVPAIRMGAYADAPEDFFTWLATSEGRTAAEHYTIDSAVAEDDFLTRALYGDYLEARTRSGLSSVKILHTSAQDITCTDSGYQITLAHGYPILAQRLVLATGNGFFGEAAAGDNYYSEPWRCDFNALAAEVVSKKSSKPIVILGSGLTAVDTLISVLARNIVAPILVLSRNGKFPAAHTAQPLALPPTFTPSVLSGLPLSGQLRTLRSFIADALAHGYSWQSAIDALRPHTIGHWQSLSASDKKRFFARLFGIWNRARHRMALPLETLLSAAQSEQRFLIQHARITKVDGTNILCADGAQIDAQIIFDCRGPGYNVTHIPLYRSLIAAGVIAPHPTGYGFCSTGDAGRINTSGNSIHAIGALLVGEYLEITAVPELRVQVHDIVAALRA